MEGHQHSSVTPTDQDGNCVTCHRPLPKEAGPAAPRKKRERIVITVPEGEEGLLESLLIQLAEKYEPLWPDLIAGPGAPRWIYRDICFAVQAAIDADLVPSEEGG